MMTTITGTKKIQPPKTYRERTRLGPVQQKILLLLLGGFALSCASSPHRQWKIIKGMHVGWKDITKQTMERAIAKLYESKLLTTKTNTDGTVTMILNDNGKKQALTYQAHAMKIPHPKVWDEKWRIVLFDIPETKREARDSFRDHLTHLGFWELQKSVSVYPFDCKNEIEFLTELHNIRADVRFIIADQIDNETHLKHIFKLD